MTNLFDKLNLRPQERRLVVIVGIVVFVVINLWLVWPHIGDLGIWQQKKTDAESALHRYEDEIRKEPTYARQRSDLRALGTQGLGEKQVALQKEIEKQARLASVEVKSWSPERRGVAPGRTNFFEEESLVIRVLTGEKELINFLYNVGAEESSLIRVRSLSLQPDGARHKLAGDITLVQSFQKSPPPKRGGAPARPASAVSPTAAPPTAAPVATAVSNRPVAQATGTNPPKTKSSSTHAAAPTSGPAKPVQINPTNMPARPVIPKRQISGSRTEK